MTRTGSRTARATRQYPRSAENGLWSWLPGAPLPGPETALWGKVETGHPLARLLPRACTRTSAPAMRFGLPVLLLCLLLAPSVTAQRTAHDTAADDPLQLDLVLTLVPEQFGDFMPDGGIADNDEFPGLTIAARGRQAGGLQKQVDLFLGNRPILHVAAPRRATPPHQVQEEFGGNGRRQDGIPIGLIRHIALLLCVYSDFFIGSTPAQVSNPSRLEGRSAPSRKACADCRNALRSRAQDRADQVTV